MVKQRTYSGDILNKDLVKTKPVIFGACLDLQKERTKEGFADNILSYLFELNVFLNSAINEPQFCYYKSLSQIRGEDLLLEDIRYFLIQLKAAPLKVLKLRGLFNNKDQHRELLKLLRHYRIRKEWYVTLKEYISLFPYKEVIIETGVDVNIFFVVGSDDLKDLKRFSPYFKVKILFYVTSFEACQEVDKMVQTLKIFNYKIIPLYTGNNLSFFEKYVFTEERDVLNLSI